MKNWKNLTPLLFLVLSFGSLKVYSQVTLCLGVDATVCPGQGFTINDCANIGGSIGGGSGAAYTISDIPFAPDPLTSGTSVTLSDDALSGALNIGFPFCFYGNTYTQFNIGANNFISFPPNNASGWQTIPIPTTGASPKNAIMGPWQDINPGLGGTVKYQLYGNAPFRRMSVSWNNIPMFSCTGQLYSSQIIIYETTNVIETHIVNKSICSGWNNGNAVHGLHNIGGTAAIVVPGRNNTQWTVTNEGKRFMPGALGIEWANTNGTTYPYNNGVLTIPASQVISGTTGYFLRNTCGGGTSISDTSFITLATPSVTLVPQTDVCSQGIGSITANPGNGSPGPFTYTWSPAPTAPLVNQASNINLFGGSYSLTQVDGNNCTSTASAVVGDNPAVFSSTIVPVSCPGGSDGTATAISTPQSATTTYLWGGGETTQTITGLSVGTYTCFIQAASGCSTNLTINVTQIPPLNLVIANQQNITCNSANNGIANITVTQGTAPYTYSWNTSSTISNTANNLIPGANILTVTDANLCIETISVILTEPDPLAFTFVSPDSIICSESSINISAVGAGGSTPYIYSWSANGLPVGIGSTITVDPLNTGTIYCVTLSEQCGSPSPAEECLTITFPTPIIPIVIPDDPKKCLPGNFIFSNTSTNGVEIATMDYTFSNGFVFSTSNLNSLSATFPYAGTYSVDLFVTSIYGCNYTSQIMDIIEVTPLPIAGFTISKNPATWFETTIQTNDVSFGNISNYTWTSEGSTNIVNNGDNAFISYPEGITGTYEINLIVTDTEGCLDTAMMTLEIIPDIIFYAPNSFTPDDDEHNQSWLFYIEGIDNANFKLEIYNRWGEVIWETNDVKAEWDGHYNGVKVQAGIYSWIASFKSLDNDDKTVRTGQINVIR